MTATGRRDARVADDNYPTPAWCVHRLLDELPWLRERQTYLEPCAGAGAILRAFDTHRAARLSPRRWIVVEKRAEELPALSSLVPLDNIAIGSILSPDVKRWVLERVLGSYVDVAITNPPFAIAQDVIDACLSLAGYVAVLLRTNFLASEARAEFMRKCPPDVYQLPNRPAFVNGKTDSTEYAWFVWGPQRSRLDGRVRVLAPTPREERCR